MKAIFSQIVFVFIYLLLYLISLLPLNVLYALAGFLFVWPMKLFGYRRTVILTNLARSFPEKQYHEIRQICSEYYAHLGHLCAEGVWLLSASEKQVLKRFSFPDAKMLEDVYAKGKSAIVLLGHYGNWEFLRAFTCPGFGPVGGYPLRQAGIAYQKINSRSFNKLMYVLRSKYPSGWHIIESRQLVRHVGTHLDKPFLYFMIADQCPGPRGKHHSAVFLHQPAYLIESPAILARHYGFAVFYGAMHPAGKGCYEFRLTPVCGDASLAPDEFVSLKYASLLEKDIQRNPPLWLWSHKRWKRRPDKKY